ncbi:GPALPP motifs-containing protein 1 isoform X2 [Nilaparvata lugens]|uniref:GPALPP motifs-containing protein 1 isoform X2 n=1 Tax=Nilaparvata lugens TaxID=108931 RepID=UPI00193EC169|nr:GPALPP motifs-containing protein 1 isoform X2 [Nilaparvata lugens]
MSSKSGIGPVLPSSSKQCSEEMSDESGSDSGDNMIGPALPQHLRKQKSSDEKEPDTTIGPALPPHLQKANDTSDPKSLGPALPPHLQKDNNTTDQESFGPALPPHLKKRMVEEQDDESEDDDVIGPVPQDSKYSASQHKLNIRAQYLKRKMYEESNTNDEKTKRESWMLELPPEKAANIGLGPRSFRMKEAPDMSDRSSWTDTPEDKLRKKLLAEAGIETEPKSEDMSQVAIKERDKAMEKMAAKCKKDKKQLSLLQMHQKEQKKKRKKEEKERKGAKAERRPFDRNIDLQANRFDDAQKKSIFKKAQLLDTRFSSGQSKFL